MKFCCFKYSNFQLLLYSICWGCTSDSMIPARNICPSPTKEHSLRPIQHTFQALNLYLSPKTSADLKELFWDFAHHKHCFELQCLFFPCLCVMVSIMLNYI